jgi:hypothetical protein
MTNDKLIQIYKGKHYYKSRLKHYPKVVAFDMDETLGSFVDLEILWCGIQLYNPTTTLTFCAVLDLYPEFLRFGILPILEYLYIKKKREQCAGLYIYTNNQCSPPWVDMIAEYLNKKVANNHELPLFDKVIHAFKINNKILELGRTTHEKTHNDFIKCTLLPKNTEICFIDNTYYESMDNPRIYYIKPRAYIHALSSDEIINRFINSDLGKIICPFPNQTHVFRGFMNNEYIIKGGMHKGIISAKKTEIDILVAQKMMYHIKEFFYLTHRKMNTRKHKPVSNTVTMRRKL